MIGDRSSRLAVAFARGMTRAPSAGWCEVSAEFIDATGAGITVMGGGAAGPMCVSNPTVAALEDVQFSLGQGPCQDAFRAGAPVAVPSFDDAAVRRWPAFCAAASDIGIAAAFAYPLQMAGANVGVLSLYMQRTGALTTDQHADSLVLAAVLAESMLSLHDASMPSALDDGIDNAVGYRAEIYQASGIVAVQLGISPADALARLRAHAFMSDRSLQAVASSVVRRELRLDDDDRTVGG